MYNHLILNVKKKCRNIGVLVETHIPDLRHMMMAMSFVGLDVLTHLRKPSVRFAYPNLPLGRIKYFLRLQIVVF